MLQKLQSWMQAQVDPPDPEKIGGVQYSEFCILNQDMCNVVKLFRDFTC
jgi:hypothetical protein